MRFSSQESLSLIDWWCWKNPDDESEQKVDNDHCFRCVWPTLRCSPIPQEDSVLPKTSLLEAFSAGSLVQKTRPLPRLHHHQRGGWNVKVKLVKGFRRQLLHGWTPQLTPAKTFIDSPVGQKKDMFGNTWKNPWRRNWRCCSMNPKVVNILGLKALFVNLPQKRIN